MRRRTVIGLLAVALLAGCKVDAKLTVDVRDDGSGVVRVRVDLDADAVRQAEAAGGKLEDRVRLTDLGAAGWKLSEWRRRADGSATLIVSKRFASADELPGVLTELSGERGPVREIELTRDSNLLNTSYELSGVADLTELTSGVLDDPELVARLTAERVDLTALDARLTQRLRDSFGLTVVVRFPDGSGNEVTVAPGSRSSLNASASELDATRAGLLVTAAVLAVLGIVILVRGEMSGARRRRRRPSRIST